MARILIVDDHGAVRSGVRAMLSGESGLEIVGEATDGREALAMCRSTQPDLVLMDVRMPDMDGLVATRAIKQQFPGIIVLILTMHSNQDYLLEAVRAGAAGYVLKDAPQRELATAIKKVLEGEVSLNRELATRLLQRLALEGHKTGRPNSRVQKGQMSDPLTPREIEVLEFMSLGMTNRDIAGELVISVGTTKNHAEHIIAKLGVSDRTQAVVQALEMGLIAFPKK
jgi:DNA-binding NarL/FixJ family response regulator